MVKNEADIIVPVVEHLFRQGVQGVLIADNGSTDDTLTLLRELASTHRIYLAYDNEAGYFQEVKMNLLCDWARRAGADWIIPFDADEFWFAPEGLLCDFLRDCGAHSVRAALHNLFPVAGVDFGQGSWMLEVMPHPTHGKTAFRSHRYAHLLDAGHSVNRPGLSANGLRVLHVPWRSYEQFRRKATQGSEALSQGSSFPGMGMHWYRLAKLSDDEARQVWSDVIGGHQVKGISWSLRGPAKLVNPVNWLTWDPDRMIVQTDS